MTAIEQAEELRQRAITILLAEREQIDTQLAQLGHGEKKAAPMKKRGRPSKATELSQPSQSYSSESVPS